MAKTRSATSRQAKTAGAPPETPRFVCIHGHFYQPPRENPWLETVEVQDSAAPYHDWNDRITAECYAPNGASRITNKEDEIIRIMNNYARMSYNFGPTLLSWLHDKAPRTYRMILDADKVSAQRYSGHGSAMAQVYNHIIMPLASHRDALTQIRWGIADFESRYHRKPEGMWLAETAVNRSVLDLMAQEGIKFTVLAPVQCARVRVLPISPSLLSSRTLSGVEGEGPASPSSPDNPSRNPLDGNPQRHRRSHPPLPRPSRRGPQHRRLLLRWPLLPCHRLRRPPQQRRRLRQTPPQRLSSSLPRRSRSRPDLPRRHRRRKLRPPPQTRRDGPLLRHAHHRGRRSGQSHQLR